ncbi:LLM class flavin-dependent oxidoreductase [Isoptericola sediminis]|uniref:LLM class flavin-dependent oxidoreductase n=1 Tax=Isoptericola sediminis TaxID=2733572 RepID=A0A849K1I0_9MICO|nr:LLM class flavin-dependent oxidoreductase [Isoptericola sediminis]
MTDYGHEIVVGAFITPSNADPQGPVRLARTAESAGLDLVTFQDHPYQPRFLDTWTLISYAAAVTERIHLAGNVLNLPLRQPAVLARSVASLDLLSSGRVDLALGAGGFWDAIAAMGGARLTPGESVTALSEAIEIVRGIWDAGERTPLRVEGEHHRVAGAKRGPAPAHDVPIWVGATKPRMLRLVARQADGWLPSYGYLQDDGLARGNTIIDETAEEVGRHPAEIRRLLNVGGEVTADRRGFLQGPVDQWVEELAGLALTHGVGTFVVATDDPRMLEVLGEEIAPALRELVARERTTGTA